MTDCRKLLEDYVRNGSEPAFCELVARYVDLVYSTARRLMDGDAHRAEDVTQVVFADLARMARTLSRNVLLGGWLHRHTCYVAANVRRGERRRQAREKQAVEMNMLHNDAGESAARLAPVLDDAINELNASDRAAIMLRFFERQDLRAIGEALASNEDAAQKRVSRALEKLRTILLRRGVSFSAATLTTTLATQAVMAAPAGLVASVSTAVLAGSAAGTGTALTLLNLMTLTKLKAAALGALVLGAGTTIVLQQQSQTRVRAENLALRQQHEQFVGLQVENARLSNQLANARAPQSLAKDQLSELMRLRGEVAQLRNQKAEFDKAREENRRLRSGSNAPKPTQNEPPAQEDYPKESWAFVGYATPEMAFQSAVWATSNGDVRTMLASMTPDELSRSQERWRDKTDEEIAANVKAEFENIKGFRILKKEPLSEDVIVLTLFVDGLNPNEGTPRWKLERVNGEWKSAGPYKERDR